MEVMQIALGGYSKDVIKTSVLDEEIGLVLVESDPDVRMV